MNSSAGAGRSCDFWLSRLARHDIHPEPCATGGLEELPPLGEHDRLIVAGGDGTLHRLAPWCVQRRCVLGVLPAGTGNDFARGLGIPLDPDAACRTLADGAVRCVDVARIEDRAFLNVAHVGLGAEVSREVASSAKHWWGRFSYLGKLLRVQWHRGFRATVVCGGVRKRSRWLEIALANGGSFGGGHRIFEASPLDGQLDVVAIRARSLPRLLVVWAKTRLHNATPADPAVVRLRGQCGAIRHCPALPVRADGEPAGQTPFSFRVDPQALRVTVPRRRADS